MSPRSLLAITGLILAASLVHVAAEAQTYCLTPSTVPQPPAPQRTPPICEPKPCNKCTNSPCYVATGIYARESVDLSIPTAGTFGLVASRLYDSSRVADGPLGLGWSSSLTPHLYYATYLVSAPSNYLHEADVELPDGVLYRFTVDSSGLFSPPAGRYDKLVRNGDGTYSLTIQHTRSVYNFGVDGSLTTLTDDFGNIITWTYDSAGRAQRVADSAGSGRYIDITWGADGRVNTLTDNSNRQTKYYYDLSAGILSGVADPTVSGNASLRSTNYTYVAGRFGKVLTRISDRWDRVISALEWNPDGRLKSYTDGFYDVTNPSASTGEQYSYYYQFANTAKANSLGVFNYPYDSNGLVNGQNYTNGLPTVGGFNNSTHYEYDSSGRITKMTSPSSEPSGGSGIVVWWYTYDTTWPDKISTIIPKDQYGNLKTNWAGWKYEYHGVSDAAPGSLSIVWQIRSDTTTTDAVGRYTYDSHGHLLAYTDVDAHTTTYNYNAAGDLVSVTAPGSNATQFSHDALGRVLSVTDPNNHATTMTYDALGRLLTLTRPRPNSSATYDTVTTFSYDNYDSATGLVFTNTTDPNGRVTKEGTDAIGHVAQSNDANGNLTKFIYQYDLLKTILDANGNEVSYGYDAARSLSRTTFSDGTFETYQISNGVLYQRTDRRGQTSQYAYDGLGRLTSIFYPGLNNSGIGIGQAYAYDGQKLIGVQDQKPDETTGYGYIYDSAWRLVTDSGTSRKITYAYDGSVSGGSMLSSYTIEPPQGSTGTTQTVSFTHDIYGRLVGQTWSWIPNTPFIFNYTPTGQYSSVTFPNGQQRRFTYDNQDRLTNITNTSPAGNPIASFDYAYDYDWQTNTYSMRGQRTSVAVAAPGAGNITSGLTKYSYDAAYQLVRADYPDNTYEAWTYDAIGNRTSKRIRNWPYPIASTYYTNATGGNSQRLRNDSFYEFTYDAAGNVRGASSQNGTDAYTWDHAGRLASYGGKTYGYDVFGRSSVTVGGSTTRYIGMDDNTVAERNSAAGVATDYIFGPGIDEPLAKRTTNGSISYFGIDGVGSVVLTTDTNGTVLSSAGYSPWGEIFVTPSPELFGYTGRENGGPSWYYRARYYDAGHARFLSEDPVRDAIKWYAYAVNDPVNGTDPSGMTLYRCSRPLSGVAGLFAGQNSTRRHVFLYSTAEKKGCGVGPKNSLPGAASTVYKMSVEGEWEYDAPFDSSGKLKRGYTCTVMSQDSNYEQCALGECSGKAPDYGACNGRACYDWVEDVLQRCRACKTPPLGPPASPSHH
jgi:RHS repeat-associated protein